MVSENQPRSSAERCRIHHLATLRRAWVDKNHCCFITFVCCAYAGMGEKPSVHAVERVYPCKPTQSQPHKKQGQHLHLYLALLSLLPREDTFSGTLLELLCNKSLIAFVIAINLIYIKNLLFLFRRGNPTPHRGAI